MPQLGRQAEEGAKIMTEIASSNMMARKMKVEGREEVKRVIVMNCETPHL